MSSTDKTINQLEELSAPTTGGFYVVVDNTEPDPADQTKKIAIENIFALSIPITQSPTISDGVKVTFNPNSVNTGMNVGVLDGTSFPTSPEEGDIFYSSLGDVFWGYTASGWDAFNIHSDTPWDKNHDFAGFIAQWDNDGGGLITQQRDELLVFNFPIEVEGAGVSFQTTIGNIKILNQTDADDEFHPLIQLTSEEAGTADYSSNIKFITPIADDVSGLPAAALTFSRPDDTVLQTRPLWEIRNGFGAGSVQLLVLEPDSTWAFNANSIFTGVGTLSDENSNELLEFTTITNAVNNIDISNNISGNSPIIKSTGSATNIGLRLDGKGTGEIETDSNIKIFSGNNLILNQGNITLSDGYVDFVAMLAPVTPDSGNVRLYAAVLNSADTLLAKNDAGDEFSLFKSTTILTSNYNEVTLPLGDWLPIIGFTGAVVADGVNATVKIALQAVTIFDNMYIDVSFNTFNESTRWVVAGLISLFTINIPASTSGTFTNDTESVTGNADAQIGYRLTDNTVQAPTSGSFNIRSASINASIVAVPT